MGVIIHMVTFFLCDDYERHSSNHHDWNLQMVSFIDIELLIVLLVHSILLIVYHLLYFSFYMIFLGLDYVQQECFCLSRFLGGHLSSC